MCVLRKPQPGFAKHTLADVERLDKAIWKGLWKEARGVKRRNGERPLDKALSVVMRSEDVLCLCMPLPTGARSSAGDERGGKRTADGVAADETAEQGQSKNALKNQNKRLKQQLAKAKAKAAAALKDLQGKGIGKGAGGPGAGNGTRGFNMPRELVGGVPRDEAGEPLCFDFNMGHGCDKAPPGGKCSKGKHLCCVPGCFKAHAFVAHRT